MSPAPEATQRPLLAALPMGLRYLLVGGVNTVAGYGVFALCVVLLQGRWPHGAILVLAHVLAVSFAFAMHHRLVFGLPAADSVIGAWLRYQGSNIGLLALGLTINYVMLHHVHPSVWLAQAVAMGVCIGAGWVLNRRFVFRAGSGTHG